MHDIVHGIAGNGSFVSNRDVNETEREIDKIRDRKKERQTQRQSTGQRELERISKFK